MITRSGWFMFVLFVMFVLVKANDFPLRLVDISSAVPVNGSHGIVQVFLDNQWLFLTGSRFSTAKVFVACRQLGFGDATHWYTPSNLTEVAGNVILLKYLKCTGDEIKLSDCNYTGWHRLDHRKAKYLLVSITCKIRATVQACPLSNFKLAKILRTDPEHLGVLMKKHAGNWTLLHVEDWEEVYGEGACKQVGFPGLVKRLLFREFHPLKRQTSFVCQKTSAGLNCCPSRKKGTINVAEIALVCEPAIRLFGSVHPNHGALQLYRNGFWYYVCGDTWSPKNTRVVCHQLGYNDVIRRDDYVPVEAHMAIWERTTLCKGDEANIRVCNYTSRARTNDKCERIVQVSCKGKNIRLAGLDALHGGRIEILHKGIWGLVIDNTPKPTFGSDESRVACRELGYHDALRMLLDCETPETRNRVVWLTKVDCKGTEKRLVDCEYKPYEKIITYPYNIGVLCKHNIQLTGSAHSNEGRLEMYKNNSWKHVCSEEWTTKENTVFCKQLGYSAAHKLQNTTTVLTKNDQTDYIGVMISCTGQENKLTECSQQERRGRRCNGQPATVKCEGNEGDIRLINLLNDSVIVNELQIRHEGIWGVVSGKTWSKANSIVACRQLSTPGLDKFNVFNRSSCKNFRTDNHDRVWLHDVSCSGNEEKLLDCHKYSWVKSEDTAQEHFITRVTIKCHTRFKISEHGLVEQFDNEAWKPVCSNDERSIVKLCQEAGFSGGKKKAETSCASPCRTGTEFCVKCSHNEYRLTNPEGVPYTGWFEIYFGDYGNNTGRGVWLRVLPANQWVKNERNKICQVLGYPSAERFWSRMTTQKHLITTAKRWNGTRIIHQPSFGFGYSFAAVTCRKGVSLGTTNAHNGTVHIYWGGQWRILSDENWTREDGDVTCRFLGFTNAVNTVLLPETGNQSVLDINFRCTGNERTLKDCLYDNNNVSTSVVKTYKASYVRCSLHGRALCQECDCKNTIADCSEKRLNWMPWIPGNFTAENVVEYLLPGNTIWLVDKVNFQEFIYLEKLDLSRNALRKLPDDLLRYSRGLKYLNLSGNKIQEMSVQFFKNLKLLQTLDISKNRIQSFSPKIFDELENLEILHTDRFTHCCYARLRSRKLRTCVSPDDVFSSCDKMLKNDFLEVLIWIVATLIFLGNVSVIVLRVWFKEQGMQCWFIASLVLSDTLMFLYLVIIAYNNLVYKGVYFEHDHEWRSSRSCTVAGVLALLASQVSLFIIVAVTTERFYCIVFVMKTKLNINRKAGNIITVLLSWSCGAVLAVIPALYGHYFNTNYVKFYGQNSVCLPLQLPESGREILGWEYCLALFGVINVILCIYVTSCYVIMYLSIKRADVPNTQMQSRDNSHLSKRMFGIVFTNLACWLPVTIFMYHSLRGFASNVRTLHAWSAVCLFPINAALNPAIYTLFAPSIRQRLRIIWPKCK